MSHAEDEDQESEQKPARIEQAESEQDEDGGPRQVELAAPEERPRDMASIELAGGQQVDRGHEEPDPAGEGEWVRMGEERVREGEEQRQGAEQERRLRLPRKGEPGGRGRRGQGEPGEGDGNRDRESDERSRHPDVQQRPAIRDRVPHADERPERAEGRDGREEEREGGLDLVPLRDEVVTHLMRAEDCQEGQREEQAAEPDRLDGQERLARVIRPVPRPAEESSGEDRDEEQDEIHLRPGESRPRTSLNMDERLALLLRDRRDVVFRDELDPKRVERAVDTSRRDADLERQRHRAHDHAVYGKVSCNRRPEGVDFRLRREHRASQPSHVLKDEGLRIRLAFFMIKRQCFGIAPRENRQANDAQLSRGRARRTGAALQANRGFPVHASSLRARGSGKDVSDVLRHSQESNETDQISQQCLRLSVSVIGGEIDKLIVEDRGEPQLDVPRLDARTVNSTVPSGCSHDPPPRSYRSYDVLTG